MVLVAWIMTEMKKEGVLLGCGIWNKLSSNNINETDKKNKSNNKIKKTEGDKDKNQKYEETPGIVDVFKG